jgi:hypothetical protein
VQLKNSFGFELFTFMALEKLCFPYMALFILNLPIWPQNKILFLLWPFRLFFAPNGVKSRVNDHFVHGKKNAEFYLSIIHLEQYDPNKF